MNSSKVFYVKASPYFVELDTEEGGEVFSKHIIDQVNCQNVSEICLDLSGNVRLDYWGCSRVLDNCIDILGREKYSDARIINVLTSLRYEDEESYAWLFFKKSTHALNLNLPSDISFAELALAACKKLHIRFNLYKVPLRFHYRDVQDLGEPNVIFSESLNG